MGYPACLLNNFTILSLLIISIGNQADAAGIGITASGILGWYRIGPLMPVRHLFRRRYFCSFRYRPDWMPESRHYGIKKRYSYTLHIHMASKGLGYTLHVHTSGVERGYTLHVHTAGGGRKYTMQVHTNGGRKGHTQQVHSAIAVEMDTPCTSILLAKEGKKLCPSMLLAVEGETSCTSILLAVERDTPCMSIMLAVDTPCTSMLLAVESDTPCTSILLLAVVGETHCMSIPAGGGKGYTLHVHTAGGGKEYNTLHVHTSGGERIMHRHTNTTGVVVVKGIPSTDTRPNRRCYSCYMKNHDGMPENFFCMPSAFLPVVSPGWAFRYSGSVLYHWSRTSLALCPAMLFLFHNL
jgi:hypothetical protein